MHERRRSLIHAVSCCRDVSAAPNGIAQWTLVHCTLLYFCTASFLFIALSLYQCSAIHPAIMRLDPLLTIILSSRVAPALFGIPPILNARVAILTHRKVSIRFSSLWVTTPKNLVCASNAKFEDQVLEKSLQYKYIYIYTVIGICGKVFSKR